MHKWSLVFASFLTYENNNGSNNPAYCDDPQRIVNLFWCGCRGHACYITSAHYCSSWGGVHLSLEAMCSVVTETYKWLINYLLPERRILKWLFKRNVTYGRFDLIERRHSFETDVFNLLELPKCWGLNVTKCQLMVLWRRKKSLNLQPSSVTD